MFSRSGRVATWGRARLNGITITETMLYKEFLDRIGQPLDEQAERRRAERRKTKKKNPKLGTEVSDSEDDEEEDRAFERMGVGVVGERGSGDYSLNMYLA